MKIKRENAAIVGVAAAACAACCAGPIVGFLAAIGVGTAAGFALFGTIALLVGAIAFVVVLRLHHRRRADAYDNTTSPVAVETPTVRARG